MPAAGETSTPVLARRPALPALERHSGRRLSTWRGANSSRPAPITGGTGHHAQRRDKTPRRESSESRLLRFVELENGRRAAQQERHHAVSAALAADNAAVAVDVHERLRGK